MARRTHYTHVLAQTPDMARRIAERIAGGELPNLYPTFADASVQLQHYPQPQRYRTKIYGFRWLDNKHTARHILKNSLALMSLAAFVVSLAIWFVYVYQLTSQ